MYYDENKTARRYIAVYKQTKRKAIYKKISSLY